MQKPPQLQQNVFHIIGIYGRYDYFCEYTNLYDTKACASGARSNSHYPDVANMIEDALVKQDIYGRTPLHYAAASGSKDLVNQMCIWAPATAVDILALGGDSVLMKAAYFCNVEIYEMLKDKCNQHVTNSVSHF